MEWSIRNFIDSITSYWNEWTWDTELNIIVDSDIIHPIKYKLKIE